MDLSIDNKEALASWEESKQIFKSLFSLQAGAVYQTTLGRYVFFLAKSLLLPLSFLSSDGAQISVPLSSLVCDEKGIPIKQNAMIFADLIQDLLTSSSKEERNLGLYIHQLQEELEAVDLNNN